MAREKRGMTQEELAEKASTAELPISQAMISAAEKRDSKKSMGLFAFAEALRVSPKWLQTGEGESGLELAPGALRRQNTFSDMSRGKSKRRAGG